MPDRTEAQTQGAQAEARAEKYLQTQGMKTVARNWLCKVGELDLIMRLRDKRSDTLIFVEVRARRNARFGSAAESIDGRKQAKLLRAAEYYLQKNRHTGPSRFDVIAITGDDIQWIPNAFGA